MQISAIFREEARKDGKPCAFFMPGAVLSYSPVLTQYFQYPMRVISQLHKRGNYSLGNLSDLAEVTLLINWQGGNSKSHLSQSTVHVISLNCTVYWIICYISLDILLLFFLEILISKIFLSICLGD